MKIGFDTAPALPAESYLRHLTEILSRHAPRHEYVAAGQDRRGVDLYHGFRPSVPLALRLRGVKSVVTVRNLNFLRYPHLYPLPERWYVPAACRRAVRTAGRVITLNGAAREELAARLKIDPQRIEVVLPLAARVPQAPPADAELEAVRRKYALPERFVLMLGTIEPRHNHATALEALFGERTAEMEKIAEGFTAGVAADKAGRDAAGFTAGLAEDKAGRDAAGFAAGVAADGAEGFADRQDVEVGRTAGNGSDVGNGHDIGDGRNVGDRRDVGAVICGRRTAYSDVLLGDMRRRHLATRVEFIYELAPRDLPALFRLAQAFVYLPDAAVEASVVPIVEALRAGLPMLLSDTEVHREAADNAALYVDPDDAGAVAGALHKLLDDETLRSRMREREARRAEVFSEYAVAERLMQIYTSL